MFDALLLLIVANGTPVIGRKLFGRYFAYPLDFHLKAPDGYPWFGKSKTFLGILLAILFTAITAWLIGLHWQLGATIGALAMAGDLLSSFIKRRFGLPSSSQVPGVDQIPESLLPLWVCSQPLALGWLEVMIAVIIFWIVEILLSRILYQLHIRNRPY